MFTSNAGAAPLANGALEANDPQYVANSSEKSFPAIQNVVAVGDGDVVSVGSLNVKAIYTPGHTPGGVTWTWQSCALNTCYDVVYADSLTAVSAPGFTASPQEATAGSGSQSTITRSAPSSAACRVSATTTATGSPT